MGAYTSSQLIIRLLALALGLTGGLCQTVWSQVVGMRCGAAQVGEYVIFTKCEAWTELFLRFPDHVAAQMVSLVLAGAIAGIVAGLGGMWRPRWAALLFVLLAAVNLGLVIYGSGAGDQKGIAIILAALSVAVPALCSVLLWWRGEYRVPRRQPAGAADIRPWTPEPRE